MMGVVNMRNFRWVTWITVAVGSLSVAAQPLSAAVVPSPTFEERIVALEKEIALLKRLKEVDQEVAAKKELETPITTIGKDGFSFKSKDGAFQLKLKGQVQTDGRFFISDDANKGTNQFLLRRARPSFEGTVYKYFDFRLMTDFGGGSAVIQDGWVDFKYWPKASLRVGKFKSPLGLERLQSDANGNFIETALSTNLIPNRDVGVDLHGDFGQGALTYDLGAFNGTLDNGNVDGDVHDDKDLVARIFTQPFINGDSAFLTGLGAGFGASFGESHGSVASPQLPSYRGFGQNTIFSYRNDATTAGTAFADGHRYRFVPQAYYYYGPFGTLSEFVLSSQGVKRNQQFGDVKHNGWQTTLNYVITGESASYNGVIPRSDFDPSKGTWGALEAVGRLSGLSMDEGTYNLFANNLSAVKNAKAWTLGLNWYWNKNIKWMGDFEQTFFEAGFNPQFDRETESALITRMQIAF